MTNFDALKQIYEALGGDKAISGTNLDALKAIAEVAGSGGGLVVHATEVEDKAVLDKTWQEIYDAFSAGKAVVLAPPEEAGTFMMRKLISEVSYDTDIGYSVVTSQSDGMFKCASASDYPAMQLI